MHERRVGGNSIAKKKGKDDLFNMIDSVAKQPATATTTIKKDKVCLCVCVRACACVCVPTCVRACVRACVGVGVGEGEGEGVGEG